VTDEGTPAALVFPGQGSQKEGSAAVLGERGRKVFERASAAIGLDLLDIAANWSEEQMRWPSIIQPLLVAHAVAAVEDAELDLGQAGYAIGHSSGQNSAATLSGSLDFEPALLLAYQRGLLLDQACKEQPGGLLALIDFSAEAVAEVCRESGLVAANYNGPGQAVVGGSLEQIEDAKQAAERFEGMVVELRVAGAFHTPLMHGAEMEARKLVDALPLRALERKVIGNEQGAVIEEPEQLRAELRDQFLRPVMWQKSVETVLGLGVRRFYVTGPGSAAFGLLRRVAQHHKTPIKAEKI
jgi:[acyl-carrier-protein] S-malonyltransferase